MIIDTIVDRVINIVKYDDVYLKGNMKDKSFNSYKIDIK